MLQQQIIVQKKKGKDLSRCHSDYNRMDREGIINGFSFLNWFFLQRNKIIERMWLYLIYNFNENVIYTSKIHFPIFFLTNFFRFIVEKSNVKNAYTTIPSGYERFLQFENK